MLYGFLIFKDSMASTIEFNPSSADFLSQKIYSSFETILREVPSNHFYSITNMRKLLDKYSIAELDLIYQDFCELRVQTFEGVTQKRDYVVTAGGPSVGKSTILEDLMDTGRWPDPKMDCSIHRAYIDPDRSCLQRMNRTYLADISSGKRSPQEAYEHWREASNFLSNVYLAIALKEGYAIAHGSTMATPYAKNALNAIKNIYGYDTTIVHVTCPEEIRKASECERRSHGVVQCTPRDFEEKQKLFFSLLSDYVQSAHRVLFCYRGEMTRSTWAGKVENGQWDIYDPSAFASIQQIHDMAQGSGFWKKSTMPPESKLFDRRLV